MGYTGDFESKQLAFNDFISMLTRSATIKKIKVFNFQDIVVTLLDNTLTYICVNYHRNIYGDWVYKYMDHTVWPKPNKPISKKAIKFFLQNPTSPTEVCAKSFSKGFIAKLKKEAKNERSCKEA